MLRITAQYWQISQMRTEPTHMVRLLATFPHIICVMYDRIYPLLQQVMEMASNLQSSLTSDEQTIKYRMKISTSKCWHSAAHLMATAGLMHCPYYHNTYSYTESPESHSPVYSSVCSRCVKQSIINFCSWVFGTLEFRRFSTWKPIWGGK